MENRNGLLVQTFLTEANGRAERDAAMLMAETIPGGKRVTLSGDKNYDTQERVACLSRFQFPSSFQLRRVSKKLSAARSIAFRVLYRASQASDREFDSHRKVRLAMPRHFPSFSN